MLLSLNTSPPGPVGPELVTAMHLCTLWQETPTGWTSAALRFMETSAPAFAPLILRTRGRPP